MTTDTRCAKIVTHLNRIQGQIDGLKRAVTEGKSCEDVAMLTSSIIRSFDAARASIIEAYIAEEVIGRKHFSPEKAEKLSRMVSLYKA